MLESNRIIKDASLGQSKGKSLKGDEGMLIGDIISGEFDEQYEQFVLQQVKHFTTETTLNENQLTALYNYLKLHQGDSSGHVITLYDQLPIRLSKGEIECFIQDLEVVLSQHFN
jgi:hypothetical protein